MKPSQRKEIVRGLSLMTSLGVTMAACVLIGLWIGKSLDNVMGTSPWMLLTFLLFGIMAAIKSMFRIVLKEWDNTR
jgi:F0F1-type ATP synthase assembly protein I